MDLNVLVADSVSPAALEVFRSTPGWRVIESSPREFAALLPDADALLVRSGAKVTAEVLENAPKLRVIGRAGVGVDNVDIAAATARGVLVMNTPGGNAVSVAEHTLALILASARSIPQASQSTKSGKWEKKKFLGTELGGKTLGIIGLGNIGLQVARRARPFAMRVVAHDPFVSRELAKDRGVEIIELDELYRTSDFVSLHLSLTAETRHILNQDAFGKMKAGVRIINCARGELIDGAALEQALKNGSVAGAAAGCFRDRAASARVGAAGRRAADCYSAHRRLDRRGAGGGRDLYRRTGQGIPRKRRHHQRGQHAVDQRRAVRPAASLP